MIDTHLHIWNPRLLKYDWLAEAPELLNQTYEPQSIMIEAIAAGITGAILVQASNSYEETHYLIHQAKTHDWIVGVVGWVDLMEPKTLEKTLSEFDQKLLRGIRHLAHLEPNNKWMLQEPVLKSLKILENKNLTLDIVGTSLVHLECTIALAKRFQKLTIVVDHLNQPPREISDAVMWKEKMKTLSQYQNVYVKVSGLGTLLNKPNGWGQEDIQEWINFCFEQFGQNRIILGSDWPICLLAANYTATLQNYQKSLMLYDEIVQEKIKMLNAINAYQLNTYIP